MARKALRLRLPPLTSMELLMVEREMLRGIVSSPTALCGSTDQARAAAREMRHRKEVQPIRDMEPDDVD